MALPNPGMKIDVKRTALVITDPQNDFLSPDGVTWGVVGESVTENNTVDNLEILFRAAKEIGIQTFVSPHYYYPTDHGWQFEGALEALMHEIGMFDRKGALELQGFEGSGADWLERYKSYINDGNTVVVSPLRCMGLKPTTWFCSFASAESTKSFWPVCRPISASSRICASCWNRVLKWRS